ncbi:MAG: glycosyltransferase [Actinobacteria bacterium]|nr:glycosyltransferase [Actinomycetota bacterium]
MIRIGIYDRYLSTFGGGERYSCKMAEILSHQSNYSVDIITDIFADLNQVSRRLNLNLSKVNLKVFPFLSEDYAEKITKEYDIFINATYLSSLSAYGNRNLYLCYFPTPFDVDFRTIHRFLLFFFRLPAIWLFKFSDRLCREFRAIEIEEGLYDIKRFFLRRGSWSSGKVIINIDNLNQRFRIGLKNPDTSSIDLMQCRILVIENKYKGNRLKIGDLFNRSENILYERDIKLKKNLKEIVEIPVDFSKKPCKILITSNTFIPKTEYRNTKDSRKLGVVVYNEIKGNIVKKIILKILGFIPLFLITYPRDLRFLKTYNKIIAISKYSKHWIEKFWKRNCTILFPPVDVDNFTSGKKEKIILSVGRFFPEHHNKKQLELAKAFIELYRDNPDVMNGYILYLVGGVEDRSKHIDYVNKIKEISSGYPVRILTNIGWKELADIFSRAYIFWHGAGMGEDEKRHPEKFEHFGITTVEAMASGCIPVVINKGGQTEIIENGKDGFLFESWEGLKKITLKICSGKMDIGGIREEALKSCKKFSNSNFEKNLLSVLSEEAGELKK